MGGPDLTPDRGATARKLTWAKAELAYALGIGEKTFDKKREALEAAGFPRRLPGLNAWSIAAVTRWVAANGRTEAVPVPADKAVPEPLITIAGELNRLYGGEAS